jgi:Zn-dependent protease with chaperone function
MDIPEMRKGNTLLFEGFPLYDRIGLPNDVKSEIVRASRAANLKYLVLEKIEDKRIGAAVIGKNGVGYTIGFIEKIDKNVYPAVTAHEIKHLKDWEDKNMRFLAKWKFQLWKDRRAEYACDAFAVKLGFGKGLIEYFELCISCTSKFKRIARVVLEPFYDHPALKKRIKAARKLMDEMKKDSKQNQQAKVENEKPAAVPQ